MQVHHNFRKSLSRIRKGYRTKQAQLKRDEFRWAVIQVMTAVSCVYDLLEVIQSASQDQETVDLLCENNIPECAKHLYSQEK